MAIVKMKKLRVIATAAQKEELLKELLLLGCVELREQDALTELPEYAGMVSQEPGDVTEARAERQIFAEAIRILDRFAPVKTPALSPKPELSQLRLMDETGAMKMYPAARNLASLEEQLRLVDSELTRLRGVKESLQPWTGCGVPLDYRGTKHIAAEFGTIPAGTDMDAFCAGLMEVSEATELIEVSADAAARYLLVFYLRSEAEAVGTYLRVRGFAPPAFGSASGTAEQNLSGVEKRRNDMEKARAGVETEIQEIAKYREEFKICFERAETKVDREIEQGKLLNTANAFLLDGWMVAERESEVAALLERMECAYEFADPEKEEYPEVPVELRNNKLTDGLNMVTNMYSLPQYGSVDPNPLMAPFFILFYGIMMADMGYGIIMMLIGGLLLWKKRPTEGFLKYFAELMLEAGAATFIMGIFTGGLFGDAAKWIVRLTNPGSTWEGFPALIDPLNDTVKVLIGAMILGFIHLNAGMVISFVMKKREGNLKDALCSEGAMWVLFLGVGLGLLGIGGKIGIYVGLAAYVLGKVIPAKGVFGRVIALLSGIYSDATGWFGDVLSYARLMALMLAGSVIAQVFNTLGAMPGNLVVFLIVCLLGNTLNFGLNLLGCYVHDLRLQCLEFFNKFYVAGGRPFRPLKIRAKYHTITK